MTEYKCVVCNMPILVTQDEYILKLLNNGFVETKLAGRCVHGGCIMSNYWLPIEALDKISRLRNENHKLIRRLVASESDLVLFEVSEIFKKTQMRVQELEQERQWIPRNKFIIKEPGLYCYVDYAGIIEIGYFQPEDKKHLQLEHYEKQVFGVKIPQPLQEEK